MRSIYVRLRLWFDLPVYMRGCDFLKLTCVNKQLSEYGREDAVVFLKQEGLFDSYGWFTLGVRGVGVWVKQ